MQFCTHFEFSTDCSENHIYLHRIFTFHNLWMFLRNFYSFYRYWPTNPIRKLRRKRRTGGILNTFFINSSSTSFVSGKMFDGSARSETFPSPSRYFSLNPRTLYLFDWFFHFLRLVSPFVGKNPRKILFIQQARVSESESPAELKVVRCFCWTRDRRLEAIENRRCHQMQHGRRHSLFKLISSLCSSFLHFLLRFFLSSAVVSGEQKLLFFWNFPFSIRNFDKLFVFAIASSERTVK